MTDETRTVVAAFGGNALSPRGNESEAFQAQLARKMMGDLLEVLGVGTRLALVHGNGPQVGAALLRDRAARGEVRPTSLAGHVAETQGSMGLILELALRDALGERDSSRPVATLLTVVEVDAADPGLTRPSKPVGPFYDEQEAARLRGDFGWRMVEDSGRGWRRVVASPIPRRLANGELLDQLVRSGAVVIAGGGGGVPVVRVHRSVLEELPAGVIAGTRPRKRVEGNDLGRRVQRTTSLRPVDGVVDKDRTAALVGELLGAELLLSLTAVEAVYADFGSKSQRRLPTLTVSEARARVEAGEFPPGSMGPKVGAAADFADRAGGEAIITSSGMLAAAMRGDAGTRVVPDDLPDRARADGRPAADRRPGSPESTT